MKRSDTQPPVGATRRMLDAGNGSTTTLQTLPPVRELGILSQPQDRGARPAAENHEQIVGGCSHLDQRVAARR